jgi:hypothetical protein
LERTRAKNLFCAARAASRAPCSVPRDKPCTIILGGLFCRTCHFQRAAFPGVCQFPGDTTISMLSVSINAIWQILAYFYTGYPCHIKLTRYPKDDRRSREGATAKASWRSPRGRNQSPPRRNFTCMFRAAEPFKRPASASAVPMRVFAIGIELAHGATV